MMTRVGLLVVLVLAATVQGQYDYSDALHKSILFYEAQRSGGLPANNRIPWRGDSAMGDRGNSGEDLTGGWYDAGDTVKFGFPLASAVTTLAWGLVEFRGAYESAGELQAALDSIKWPLDYFIKCHVADNQFYGQVADGNLDHSHWGRPEEMTMERPAWRITASSPGSDLAGETAAAMAASSIAFRPTNPSYADTLVSHARRLYDFAYAHRGKYSDSITDADEFYSSTSYEDELAWGALWLYRVTSEQQYLDKAREFYDAGTAWAFDWDDKDVGVQALFYKITNEAQYQDAVERFIRSYMPGGGIHYTPKGLAWRSEWGSNRYAANAAFVALVSAEYGIMTSEARDWARGQIHYMLGDNGRSLVVGFGVNPPQRAHHKAASCPWPPAPCNWNNFNDPNPNPHVLDGALVGGPGRNDDYVDDRTDYVKNEVTNDYNAGFQGALAGLISLSLEQ